MKKIIPQGLTALFIVFLFGTLLASCGPIFEVGEVNGNGGTNGGNPPPPPPPPSGGYTTVKAYDSMELADYLQSDETSYAITLDSESKDIYLQGSISIVKPMKIIGSPENIYTIHSVNRAGGNAFCLDLQADLEMEYCSFVGYNGTSGAVNGIAAGSPPLNIRAGRTLTLTGTGTVLELRGVGSGVTIRPDSQVKLAGGAGILDESGDLIFKSGVERLIVSGKVSLNRKLTVGSGGTLQIANGGELHVESGAILTLNNDLKELKLDGYIVVDRTTTSSAGVLALSGNLDSLLEKITGGGSLNIENGIPETTATPFGYGANTTVKLSSYGITLGKRVSSEIGGEIRLTGVLTIPKEKKLIVGAGAELNVINELNLKGGTLDVAGNVNVTGSGKIIINDEDKFTATPKGTVLIGTDGIITIDGGTFKDESVSRDAKIFTFPAYGAGSLIIKNTGHALMGADEVIGGSGPLTVAGANSSLTIKNGPAFTLTGTGTLTVPSDGIALEGRFNIVRGAVLTVDGGNTLTVKAPNQLTGTNTDSAAVQLKIVSFGTRVEYYTTGNDLVDEFGVGDYKWDGPPADWIP